jgi:hypothetical protein
MSKIHKLPAIQFYVGDWRKDPSVQSLNYHDRGVWFEMICLMHESEERGKLVLNGQPMPIDALARLLGLDKQILTTTLTTLLTYGVASQCPDTGIISNRRMIRDEEIRKIRANAGKLGGNPALLKQNSTTKDKQITTPSTTSSVSISSTNKKFIKPTIDELRIFCKEIGHQESDGDAMFYMWESNGWKNGKSPCKDWKSGVRRYASEGWLASQKNPRPFPKPLQSRDDRHPNELKETIDITTLPVWDAMKDS